MSLGEKLTSLRKQAGMSQEEVAEKLNVTRQTVSKWEKDLAAPEMGKAKLLSELFHVSYAYFVSENVSQQTTDLEAMADEIDWTSAWSKKYPILAEYQTMEQASRYTEKIAQIYGEMRAAMGLSELDTFLVMKDMIYQLYLKTKNRQ